MLPDMNVSTLNLELTAFLAAGLTLAPSVVFSLCPATPYKHQMQQANTLKTAYTAWVS